MNRCLALLALIWLPLPAIAADFRIATVERGGQLTWTNAATNAVITVETAQKISGPWQARQNFYSTNTAGRASLTSAPGNEFRRLLSVNVSTNAPQGYTNLLKSYGRISTIAGKGQFTEDDLNYWEPRFEGGFATNANLSRPHFAMADPAGNVFIADKNSHSILKVTPDGRIHTVAGTHVGGDNGNGPAAGTSLQLNSPNGLWVRGDGTVYILDTDNDKVRRLGTNGMMTTMFTVSGGITHGRGLWVKDDERLVYFCSGSDLKRWTNGTVSTRNSQFNELGNIVVNAQGNIIATDRGDHEVYRVTASNGNRTKLFGSGATTSPVEGTLALTNGLNEVRGVWLVPTGGYLLATHAGSQILYVDAAGVLRVFVSGQPGAHAGDGDWFHAPGDKVSEVRSVTMDPQGNVLITESDAGFIRKIEFLRMAL